MQILHSTPCSLLYDQIFNIKFGISNWNKSSYLYFKVNFFLTIFLLLLLLLLLWQLFQAFFLDFLFLERSFMLFRGNFPLYFLIKKIDVCLFNFFFFFFLAFSFSTFSLRHMFFLINRFFWFSFLISYFYWWNFKMRFSNMKMKQIASKHL